MTAVALFGAGGKMGYRLASNLKGSRFDVRHVELSEPGQEAARRTTSASRRSMPIGRSRAPRSWCWRFPTL